MGFGFPHGVYWPQLTAFPPPDFAHNAYLFACYALNWSAAIGIDERVKAVSRQLGSRISPDFSLNLNELHK